MKDIRLSVRCSQEFKDEIAEMAKKEGMTISNFVGMALSYYLSCCYNRQLDRLNARLDRIEESNEALKKELK